MLLLLAFCGQSLAYRAWKDDVATALTAKPSSSRRPDFSKASLTYLGHDRVLAFNQWTGGHALWRLERDAAAKCDAFAWPPLSTGRFSALRYTEFVFVGLTQLVSLDPRAGTLTLTECDDDAFLPRCKGAPLRCTPLFTATLDGSDGTGGPHELTYLGQDLLLHYERSSGDYALLTFSRSCGGNATEAIPPRCGLSTPLVKGRLPPGAYHTYLGGDQILAYLPIGSYGGYELYSLTRNGTEGTSIERVGGGTFSLTGSFSDEPRRHRLMALQNGLLLDYDKETSEYRLLDLNLTKATSLDQAGDLLYTSLAESNIPASSTDGCASHATSASCLDSPKCGWCQSSGRCIRGDAEGPCKRAACSPDHFPCGAWHSAATALAEAARIEAMKKTLAKDEAALKAFSTKIVAASGFPNVPLAVASPTFTNITTVATPAAAAVVKPSKPAPIPYQLGFDTHELTYLGYDAILDSMPHTGHYVLWQLDANAPTKAAAAPLLTPPLSGSTWNTPYRRFAYLGFDTWLEYAPSTGAYALHRCAHERWGIGLPPLCAPLCDADGCGVSADLAGDTKVLYLGHDALLAIHPPTGSYAMLRVERGPAKLAEPPADAKSGLRGTIHALAGKEIAFIGNQMLVALDYLGTSASFYLLARNASEVWQQGSPLRAKMTTPSSATAAILSSGSRKNNGRLVGLSGGRVLAYKPKPPTGFAYELVKCDAPPCAAPDCPSLGLLAPTNGEVICSMIGAGDVGADSVTLQVKARDKDADSVGRDAIDVVEEIHPGIGLASKWPIIPSKPTAGGIRRQWLLLDASDDDGDSTAVVNGRKYGMLSHRSLLEYDSPSADVRLLELSLPRGLPIAPTPITATSSPTAAATAAISSCDAIPLPAQRIATWPFASHRLSSLGGSTILDVDVDTSEFRVWQCDKAVVAKPSLDALAMNAGSLPCETIDHGVWLPLKAHGQALWLGKTLGDVLLLFDSTTGGYQAWPLRQGTGRTLPRPGQQPLAVGTWPSLIGWTLVYAGGSTLVALDPTSGNYEVLLLDSSAFQPPLTPRKSSEAAPTLPYGKLSSGTLGQPTTAASDGSGADRPCAFSYHSPSYLGDDLLLSVEPGSGQYCILHLNREQPSLPPLEHVGGGNLMRKPCDHTACDACSAEPGCGWCAASNQCLQGNTAGACGAPEGGGGCKEHWTYGYCAEAMPCAQFATCDDCLASELCGWCEGRRQCMAGSAAEPLHLSCPAEVGYYHNTCPGRVVVNATVAW